MLHTFQHTTTCSAVDIANPLPRLEHCLETDTNADGCPYRMQAPCPPLRFLSDALQSVRQSTFAVVAAPLDGYFP